MAQPGLIYKEMLNQVQHDDLRYNFPRPAGEGWGEGGSDRDVKVSSADSIKSLQGNF